MAKEIYSVPRIGIGVTIIRDGRVLLGKRINSHGQGQYAFPGGHLEYLESFADCAKREVSEETGLKIENIRFLCLYNMKTYAPKHFVHISVLAECLSGEPQVNEPEKCESWGWYNLDDLPAPLFDSVAVSLEAYKNPEKNFIDN